VRPLERFPAFYGTRKFIIEFTTLRKEYRLRVYEKRVLGRIYGLNRDVSE
jgi:hypothetical protein